MVIIRGLSKWCCPLRKGLEIRKQAEGKKPTNRNPNPQTTINFSNWTDNWEATPNHCFSSQAHFARTLQCPMAEAAPPIWNKALALHPAEAMPEAGKYLPPWATASLLHKHTWAPTVYDGLWLPCTWLQQKEWRWALPRPNLWIATLLWELGDTERSPCLLLPDEQHYRHTGM